ncbi:MAG: hypothetical protein ACLPQS_06370 [Acidimicrobiales bacterium]
MNTKTQPLSVHPPREGSGFKAKARELVTAFALISLGVSPLAIAELVTQR